MRGDDCFTEDPRRPGLSITREWIEGSIQQQPLPPERSVEHRNEIVPSDPYPIYQTPPSPMRSGRPDQSSLLSTGVGISPVHQPHEMAFNLDHDSNRIKMMGASSSQTLAKSLDVYFKSAHVKPLSSHFIHGMRHTEELTLPSSLNWPFLPDLPTCDAYLGIFFNRIHTLYPLFDIDRFKAHVRRIAELQDLTVLPSEQLAILASAYLVMSLGADEQAQRITADGDKYLQAAASMLSHVILMPYLPSIQCLLLFTIAFRGRNKDGAGWQALGMAIRIAQSLGLHRFSSIHPTSQHGIQVKYQQLFHARIWGICCCLEKTMELETGRPSAIISVDRDQMMGPEQRPPSHDFLQWYVGLAKFQGQISQHIYGHSLGSRSTRQILLDTAELDMSLLSWANQVPLEFRPGTDLFCSNQYFHTAAYLSIQYNQAMIALHRAALIAPSKPFEREVSEHCSDQPSQHRLKKGESICVNSARAIARLAIDLEDRGTNSVICSTGPPLLACIVLGIYLMKNSSSRLQAADVELLRACAELTSEQALKSGMDPRFCEAPIAIFRQVSSHYRKSVTSSEPNQPAQDRAATDGTSPLNASTSERQMDKITTHSECTPAHKLSTQQQHQNFLQPRNRNSRPYISHQEPDFATAAAAVESPSLQESNPLMDEAVPFYGLNIEDLWNWMGADQSGDHLGWMDSSVSFEQIDGSI